MTAEAGPNQPLTDRAALGVDGEKGTGVSGMWWVAWRQHRFSLAVSLGVLSAVAATLLVFRVVMVNRIRELSGGALSECAEMVPNGTSWTQGACPDRVYWTVLGEFSTLWRLLELGMVVLPLVLGAFVGAPLFAREYERHTQVWVLTQSIGRSRWWSSKVIVAAAPVVLAMVGIGLLMDWAAAPFAEFWLSPMDTPGFETRSIIPAAFTMLSIAVGVTTGIVVRSTVIALVVTLITAGLLVVALGALRPHLLAPERTITPIQLSYSGTRSHPGSHDWYLDSGYLDATGTPVGFTGQCPALDNAPATTTSDTANRLWLQCQTEQGITSEYVDYLPAERRTTLETAVTAITVALSAIILAGGVVLIRRRVL